MSAAWSPPEGSGERPRRLVTNMAILAAHAPPDVDVTVLTPAEMAGVRGAARTAWTVSRADAALFGVPTLTHALAGTLARALSGGDVPVYYFDVLLPPDGGPPRARLLRALRARLLSGGDAILTVHRDVAQYARILGVPPSRFHYVGFKSNLHEHVEGPCPEPGGYVLACGQSYRDYHAFAEAMRITGLPGKVLLPPGSNLELHGSVLPARGWPDNVAVEPHDFARASWIRALEGARVVVVPLRADTVQPAGISVYLEAMNLGRPVVVSDGPSARGMLSEAGAALVVPPDDADVLAAAVRRLWSDEVLRRRVTRAAVAYADTLGGTARLARDLHAFVADRGRPRSRMRVGARAALSSW